MKKLLPIFCSCFFIGYSSVIAQNIQKITATKGKEFWLGFMTNYDPGQPNERLDIFITSNVNTSGTVSIPQQGYSVSFTVVANVTTTVNLPNGIAETITTEVIDNKGIYIEALDTVSVYAINFDEYTADGTLVLPYGSMGTDYRITSYVGLQGYTYNSEFLIVATQDGTQVEIIPSANTFGGKIAGNSYVINLNAGQTYRVEASSSSAELTGSTIRGTPQNGACRPFAVFTGVECVNIPVGCTWCDHIYEQEYPTNIWGRNYMIAPFASVTNYTYKVLANSNGTNFSVNGGASQSLNAGQWFEANNVTGPVYITANKGISVTQFMQGRACSGGVTGDPAQLLLSPADQVLDDVTFSTVTSTVINQHVVNVIMKNAFTSQLTLDGTAVTGFTSFTPNPQYSYKQITLTQGSHTLHADSGFIAYAYGMGQDETYAYALGSFNEETVIPVDTIYCTSDSNTITLVPPETVLNPVWTTVTDTNTIIGTTQTITVTVEGSEIYLVTGISALTGCPYAYKFSVETPDPPNVTYTVSADTICKFESVNFNLSVTPFSTSYSYVWSPTTGLNNPYIANPVATPLQSTWYYVTVSTFSGCGSKTDSIYIFVRPGGNISQIELTTDNNLFCLGDSAQLNLTIENIIWEDSINPTYNTALWSSISGASASANCGYGSSGNALYFNSGGNRFAATSNINTVNGGTVYFALKIAAGTAPCENADSGEDVVLEYSTNGGGTWTIFQTYNENAFPYFKSVSAVIPSAAQTTATRFRWRQLANSGAGQDNWALDDIFIGIKNNSFSSFAWTPSQSLSDSTITNPMAHPNAATMYYITVIDTATDCIYNDSVFVNVGLPFTLNLPPDDTICQVSGVSLFANPSIPETYFYSWTPSFSLSNDSIANPLATPTGTTTYYVNVNSVQNCTASDSVTIYVPAIAQFYATPSADSICTGDTVQLNTVFVQACGTNGSVCGTPISISQIGTSSATTSSNNGTLFNGSNYSSRFQMLITAADLKALGDSVPSTITEVGFKVSAVQGNNLYKQFTIKMGCTSLAALTSNFVPNLMTVYTPKNVLISANTLYYGLNNTFDWDGVSNIIVEVCYNNTLTGANSSTFYTSTLFNSYLSTTSSAACNAATGTVNKNRPNIYFKKCISPPVQNNLTFSWTPSAGLNNNSISNPLAMPGASSMYYLSATDNATGCIYTDSVFVQVDASIPLSLGNDTGFCSGTNYTLNAGAGFQSYLWNDGSTASTKTVTASGLYWVQVSNSCGTLRDSVQVTISGSPINLNLGNDTTLCNTASVTLNAFDSASIAYSWSNNLNDSAITVNTTGTYIVTVTAACGSKVDSIHLTFDTGSPINLGADKNICDGSSVTLNAGSGFSNYTWNTGDTSQTLSVNSSGTYFVSASNACGTFSDTVVITIEALPSVELGEDTTLCEGNPITLTVSNCNNCSYFWTGGSTDSIFTITTDGSYFVMVSNVCGNAQDNINVFYNVLPVVNLGADTSFCGSSSIFLNAFNPSCTYFWNTGTTGSSISVTTAGTYSVDVTNDCGTVSDFIVINMIPYPAVDLGADAFICNGDNVLLVAGNSNQVQYLWYDNTSDSTLLATSGGIYSVTVSNSCGNDADTILVTEGFSPSVDLGNDISICEDSFAIVSAQTDSTYQYLWNDSSTNSSITVDSSGIYSVIVSNGCGSDSDSVLVTVNPFPIVELGTDTFLCITDTILLDVSQQNCTYLWWDNSISSTHEIFTDGKYWVNVTSNNCKSSDTIMIYRASKPNVVLRSDTSICPEDELMLEVLSSNTENYEWQDGSANPFFLAKDSGWYAVTVKNSCGTFTDSVQIKNKDCVCHVDVPSAFSPNGDGSNEVLYLRGNCVTDINFYVYDRWGQLVFESHDLSVGWDGTFKGKKMDTAVFVYYLSSKSYYDPEGEATVKKGNVSLIR